MKKKTIKGSFRKIAMSSFISMALPMSADTAHAEWQVEASDSIIMIMQKEGVSTPKRQGSFCTRSECEEALRRWGIESGDPDGIAYNFMCVGFDCPSPSQQQPAGTTAAPPGVDRRRLQAEQEAWAAQQAELARQQAAQTELARQAREKELAKQREFERDREELARQLKSPALRQLESVAGSSQQATGTASAGQLDPARQQADFVAGPGGIPVSSVSVPAPQTPVARLKEYVAREQKAAEVRRQTLSREWETVNKAAEIESERRNRKENQLFERYQEVKQELDSLVVPADPPPDLREKKDSLEEEAQALLAEAEALGKQVQELRTQLQATRQAQEAHDKRDQALRAAVTAAKQEPERAEELLRKLQEETP